MVALASTAALLLYNGTIRTNTRSLDAVVPSICFDSTIKATGTLDAVAAACPGARRVDLGGATAVPGLTDSHAHIMLEAARRRKADLSSCEDATSCASVLEKWGAAHPLQNWVQGFGFDQTSWPGGKWPKGAAPSPLEPVAGADAAYADHRSTNSPTPSISAATAFRTCG